MCNITLWEVQWLPGSSPDPGGVLVGYFTLAAFLHPHSQTKELGHEKSFPLPPLSMLIIRWFFPFLLEKNALFSNINLGEGGYVVQLKCPFTYHYLKIALKNTTAAHKALKIVFLQFNFIPLSLGV